MNLETRSMGQEVNNQEASSCVSCSVWGLWGRRQELKLWICLNCRRIVLWDGAHVARRAQSSTHKSCSPPGQQLGDPGLQILHLLGEIGLCFGRWSMARSLLKLNKLHLNYCPGVSHTIRPISWVCVTFIRAKPHTFLQTLQPFNSIFNYYSLSCSVFFYCT